ncbi:MAG: pyridoxamine 5'-phosphate oxidase family protein [Pseudomonadota bacterium]
MVDLDRTKEEPAAQFWDEVENIPAGMLAIEGSKEHPQPMAPQLDRERGQIFFFTKKSTDLARNVGEGRRAHFTIIGRDHDYHACCSGDLRVATERDLIDEHWSATVGAWFDGKDDPELLLLQFTPLDAAVWASTSSSVVFGWEVLKANIANTEPDVSAEAHIKF